VLQVLRAAGHLGPDKGRPFDCKPRLPGLGPTRCYRIKASIFEGDE
jgi:putative DNA primase/helicase